MQQAIFFSFHLPGARAFVGKRSSFMLYPLQTNLQQSLHQVVARSYQIQDSSSIYSLLLMNSPTFWPLLLVLVLTSRALLPFLFTGTVSPACLLQVMDTTHSKSTTLTYQIQYNSKRFHLPTSAFSNILTSASSTPIQGIHSRFTGTVSPAFPGDVYNLQDTCFLALRCIFYQLSQCKHTVYLSAVSIPSFECSATYPSRPYTFLTHVISFHLADALSASLPGYSLVKQPFRHLPFTNISYSCNELPMFS